MKTLTSCAAALALVALSGSAQAALIDRGGGMISDTTRNLTWLADMNYAKTSGYDNDGLMTWAAAKAWAEGLSYGGFDDWRLPTLSSSDTSCSGNFDPGGAFGQQYYGNNCTGGELSGLFVTELGYNNNGLGLIASDDTAEQIANQALFANVQATNAYWSGSEYAPDTDAAWVFVTDWQAHYAGYQGYSSKGGAFYALAVRSDDVADAVPEPQTLSLALLALAATAVVRKRRPR